MRRSLALAPKLAIVISIHAPRAGCDLATESGTDRRRAYFNPRTPCGVRREFTIGYKYFTTISIHAPRAGCDSKKRPKYAQPLTFQSTHPVRGATSLFAVSLDNASEFQSTHPVRGATCRSGAGHYKQAISIHAPRAGCDMTAIRRRSRQSNFNPRTPCGVRLRPSFVIELLRAFQSTHPVRGATLRGGGTTRTIIAFQSTHPVRGATINPGKRKQGVHISIHAPRAGCDLIGDFGIDGKFFKFQSTHPVRGATSVRCVCLC